MKMAGPPQPHFKLLASPIQDLIPLRHPPRETMPPLSVLRVGITGASGRMGTLLLQELGTAAAPVLPEAQGGSGTVTVLVPFTYNVSDYAPWAGSAGAAAGGASPFSGAVSKAGEAAAIEGMTAAAATVAATARRLVREPCDLDLGDAEAVAGAFSGLDIVIHLAATIHADAPWDSVSRNNINATHNVIEECVRSGVRRLIFASSNHTQAADLFTSLDPEVEGGLCALRVGAPSMLTLERPAAPDGFYALSKLLGEEMCKSLPL